MTWTERADETFVVGMPRRRRIIVEMLLLMALVFGGTSMMTSPTIAAVVVAIELAVAVAVVRPWSSVHGGIASRLVACLLVVLAVIAPALIERPSFAGESRHLGIGTAASAREDGDPPWTTGMVRVQSVEPHSPADGVLRAGDRIVAIDGKPFTSADAASELSTRTHGDELPEDTTVTVFREHVSVELAVHVPKVHRGRKDFGRVIVAMREASSRHLVLFAAGRGAFMILLLWLVLRADGQSLASLGVVRQGALREALHAMWMTVGAFAVTVIVAIPIGAIGMAAGILKKETAQRSETLATIASQGSILEFALAAIVAAAFEEIAFRGFLTPRMRTLVGSWPLAVLLVSMLFGLGHIYEGVLATVQTAFLGAYFAAMMLLRRRLVGPALAHAAFNTIMLVFIRIVSETHIVERLQEQAR